ncbi:DUF2157 domain-containing protein [Hyphococcus luteus]|uniref:DUF2157 domain-containing protein n=1 Tax=Hyphococcus luteus TaxID=2058213 RepID=UPI0013FD70A7|nr:DUF2157 domain-containing protein [Marinicaulis flavus]
MIGPVIDKEAPRTPGTLQSEPQDWALALFVLFGAAQIIAAVIFFFAYNWRELADPLKIALPQLAMGIGFLGWAVMGRRSRLGAAAGILATAMIGVSMGVVGQVYQLGADPWRLFAIWAAFALPLSIIARNDAHFAVWFLIVGIAFFLYTEETWGAVMAGNSVVSRSTAIYAAGAAVILFLREITADGAPRWLAWLIAAAALAAPLFGGVINLTGGAGMFETGVAASLALFAVSGGLFAAYRYWRPDRPVQAMAMFAPAAWIAVFGLRVLFSGDFPDSAGAIAGLFFLSALWIVAVTAVLAPGLKRLRDERGAS